MSLDNVDFKHAIQDAAAALGRTPSADQVAALDQVLKSAATHDAEAGVVSVDGEPITAYLERCAAAFPRAAVAGETPLDPHRWVRSPVGSSTGWRRASDPFHAIASGFDQAHADALRREMKDWANPWNKGGENRTRQQVIQKYNPALAADMKSEAAR